MTSQGKKGLLKKQITELPSDDEEEDSVTIKAISKKFPQELTKVIEDCSEAKNQL